MNKCRVIKEKKIIQKYSYKWKNLGSNVDLKLSDLERKFKNNDGEVYAYIVATIGWDTQKQRFIQKGCAPNFQRARTF